MSDYERSTLEQITEMIKQAPDDRKEVVQAMMKGISIGAGIREVTMNEEGEQK